MQAIIQLNWSPSNDPNITNQTILMNGGELMTIPSNEATAQITVPCDSNIQIGIRTNGGPSYPVAETTVYVSSVIEYSGPANLSWSFIQFV